MINRRRFVLQSAISVALLSETLPASRIFAAAAAAATALEAWRPGILEIHHIATNRGNSALMILPDGTTMMVDAGALYGETPYLSDPRPSKARRPGEWIGRYVQRRLSSAGLHRLDVFLLTHLHADHVGDIPPGGIPNAQGFISTGVSDVDSIVPISRFVDRAWPDFSYPVAANAGFQRNYRAFLDAKQKGGIPVDRFRVGVKNQFRLQNDEQAFPSFEIRNLAANGQVWTGKGEETSEHFPQLSTLNKSDYPSENCCSAAIRLQYGRFRYYTGGDLTCDTNYGRDPWRDIETPVAQACGPVSVAVANHHGYFNADGADWVRALTPRVVIIPTWDSAHPTVNTLATLFSKAIYPDPRDVFATLVKEANHIANKKTDDLKSRNGHVVVRVESGGSVFRVHVLSNEDEEDRVVATFGPYAA